MADETNGPSDETLIAYVQGRLSSEEAARIGREAERRPELAAEIAVMRGIAAAVAAEASGPAPGELGWARLSRTIDALPRARGPVQRPIWHLAASAAAAVLLWQAVAVPLLSTRQEPGYAPVSEQPATAFGVSVAFDPGATEGAIRELLLAIDARIDDGPTAIGLWRLSFETEAARTTGLERLRAADVVESAQAE